MTDKLCRCHQAVNLLKQEGLPKNFEYTSSMICGVGGQAGSTDACKGDSGGALVREIPVKRFIEINFCKSCFFVLQKNNLDVLQTQSDFLSKKILANQFES